jgi:hypothetical protein
MRDLEFHVNRPNGKTYVGSVFGDATALAITIAVNTQKPVHIDVCAFSESAAREWTGEQGADSYNEDPEASVFDRIVIIAESVGRVA